MPLTRYWLVHKVGVCGFPNTHAHSLPFAVRLIPNGRPMLGALFGASVSISGTWVVVGAPGDAGGPGGSEAGAIHFMQVDTGTGCLVDLQKVYAPNATAFDNFGTRINQWVELFTLNPFDGWGMGIGDQTSC